jgi:hypothetical protein
MMVEDQPMEALFKSGTSRTGIQKAVDNDRNATIKNAAITAAGQAHKQGALEGYQAGALDESAKWKSALLPLRADQQYANMTTGGTQFPQPVPQFNSLSEKAAYEQRMNGGM